VASSYTRSVSEVTGEPSPAPGPAEKRPSLTAAVRRRRADEQFFLRLRDAIVQNHKALERLTHDG
jgi:hypothetical protein